MPVTPVVCMGKKLKRQGDYITPEWTCQEKKKKQQKVHGGEPARRR
jgi:hypothetical protein